MNQKGFVNIAIIIGIVVIAGIAGYFVLSPQTTTSPTPTPTPTPTTNPGSNIITVPLGQEFTLKKGQVAKIANTSGLEIEIRQFFNSPCPAGSQCVWSGVGVAFEARLNGDVMKGRDALDAFGFHITVAKTDYETYADFTVARMYR